MDERQAFESGIDANPLDATNHLVYADWLDEHGEADEAAFRRAMGQWHAGHKYREHSIPAKTGKAGYIPSKGSDPNFVLAGTGVYLHPYARLPQGVSGHTPEDTASSDPFHGFDYYTSGVPGNTGYRRMENSFRQSFMANRPQQMARAYSRAFRASRRV